MAAEVEVKQQLVYQNLEQQLQTPEKLFHRFSFLKT